MWKKRKRWPRSSTSDLNFLWDLKACSHDPFWRIRFLLVPKNGSCEHIKNDLPSNRSVILKKTDGNRTCSIFIRHSPWKMKGTDKFCTIVLAPNWRFFVSSEITDRVNTLQMTFRHSHHKKRNLEIGPSERLLPVVGSKNRILKNGSCERALRKHNTPNRYVGKSFACIRIRTSDPGTCSRTL